MSIFDPTPSRWAGRVLSIVRIVVAAVFITFGTMKVFNYPPLPAGQPPIALFSQAGIGGLMEIVGGALLVLGLFTRPVAFILSGEMAVAYWQFHAPTSPFPSENMGAPAMLYCFFWFYLVFAGPGPWSLDALIARRRGEVRAI
jgi:putative oxidoreductase